MFKKRLDLYITHFTNITKAELMIQKGLKWYYSNELHQLVVRFYVLGTKPLLAHTLNNLTNCTRSTYSDFKDNPNIEIVILTNHIGETILDTIQQLDEQSPKILLLPSISDFDGFNECRNSLKYVVSQARQRHIETRVHFNITASESIESLRVFLHEELDAGEELSSCMTSNYPVVDISPLSNTEDLDGFVQQIASLWDDFPWLNDSVAYGSDGLNKMFYKSKEMLFLNEVVSQGRLNIDFAKIQESNFTKTESTYHTLFQNELSSNNGKGLAPFERKMIALDNDWDFVFDSYECQSPIFMPERGEKDV